MSRKKKELPVYKEVEIQDEWCAGDYHDALAMAGKEAIKEFLLLAEQDKIVVDYLKGKREANMNGAGETDTNGEVIDQTPAQYDGEQSQEASSDEITIGDVPF